MLLRGHLLSLGVLAAALGCSLGHVVLTYPPARLFPLDFLDNSRTAAPCGMDRGRGPVTKLEAGSNISVTWHIAYPHVGGFFLELMDANQSVIERVPNGTAFLDAIDPTSLSHTVTLPSEECNNCTLRIVRQAMEVAPNRIFWSCADVDILSSVPQSDRCSGHGSYSGSGCQCERTYLGNACQYKEDCVDDSDCGVHGSCIDTDATSYPKKQCYCKAGWFGKNCQNASPVNEIDRNDFPYKETELSPSFHLYHRVLQDRNEIEFIIRAKTTSWVAVGFRPRNATARCQAFPTGMIPHPRGKRGPTAAPETTAQPKSTGEPVSTAEPHSTGEPVSTAEPHSTGEPMSSCAPHTTGEPQTTGEPVSTAEPHSTGEPASTSEPRSTGKHMNMCAPQATGEPQSTGEPARAPHHPMDCTDLVVGRAKGQLSKVGDFYTRGRSTPLEDAAYGGSESLTAATGHETQDGFTVILFRRKLTATERTDHTIRNELTHVIWAMGQPDGGTLNGRNHSPSIPKFFGDDVLKYHGRGAQRGVASINFLESPAPAPTGGDCRGRWPTSCPSGGCPHSVTWTYDATSDQIAFTMQARMAQSRWLGIGFSQDRGMASSDAVVGWVNADGSVHVSDRYLAGYSAPAVDTQDDVILPSGSFTNGVVTISFRRQRNTGDGSNDFIFGDSDNTCAYFFFAQGGTFDGVSKTISRHANNPAISAEKICVRSCSARPDASKGGKAESVVLEEVEIILIACSVCFVLIVLIVVGVCKLLESRRIRKEGHSDKTAINGKPVEAGIVWNERL